MTFDDLRSFLEKKNRKCAILDNNFKILWDKDGFFGSWKINYPKKKDFFDRDEIIISIGADNAKIPAAITRIILKDGETRYICEAYDHETVSELASKSEIAELLKNYLTGINDKIQVIQFLADQFAQNPLIQSDPNLLCTCKNQTGAAFDLLALSTNLNYYFNTFSYTDKNNKINIHKTIDELVKKCNELLGKAVIILNSKTRKTENYVCISERIFTVVFLNLIQNALLYSKQDSKIEVKIFYADNNAIISVTNEIADVTFSRLPDTEKINLGIGLPLVERIAVNIGGKFSNEREGSTYKAHITLPLYIRSDDENAASQFEVSKTQFITQNTSYVRRYLNQFIED
jgi:hypothetical protein